MPKEDRSKNRDARKREFLTLLGEYSGNIGDACHALDIPRSLYYYWRDKDEEFAGQCQLIIDSFRSKRREDRDARGDMNIRTAAPMGDHEEEPLLAPEAYKGKPASIIRNDHAKFLRDSLQKRGLYDDSLEPQILNAATLYASLSILESVLDSYSPIQVEISREGNPRLVSNPIHDQIRKHTESYNSMMKALGLNFDAKVGAKEEDGVTDLLKIMQDDD